MVSSPASFGRRRGIAGVAIQPLLYDVVVELFGPQQTGEALPHDIFGIGREIAGNNRGIEIISLTFAGGKEGVEGIESGSRLMLELEFVSLSRMVTVSPAPMSIA